MRVCTGASALRTALPMLDMEVLQPVTSSSAKLADQQQGSSDRLNPIALGLTDGTLAPLGSQVAESLFYARLVFLNMAAYFYPLHRLIAD